MRRVCCLLLAMLLLTGCSALPEEDRAFAVVLGLDKQGDAWRAWARIPSYQQEGGYLTLSAQGRSLGEVMAQLEAALPEISTQSVQNLPPRLRMSAVYAVSQSVNGRVANTCNLSEDYVGYSTRYGDSVGDFSPLSRLTVQEVKAVGRALGLPDMFVEKPPIDGLCGKTDEDNLGFSYATLDRYIRTGVCEDAKTRERIDHLHRINQFKLQLMPAFQLKEADFSVYAE